MLFIIWPTLNSILGTVSWPSSCSTYKDLLCLSHSHPLHFPPVMFCSIHPDLQTFPVKTLLFDSSISLYMLFLVFGTPSPTILMSLCSTFKYLFKYHPLWEAWLTISTESAFTTFLKLTSWFTLYFNPITISWHFMFPHIDCSLPCVQGHHVLFPPSWHLIDA